MTQTTRKEMTDRWLRTLEVPATRLEFSDTRQTGLRLRLSPEGSKIFLLRARGLDGRNHAITLGHYPSLSLKEARERAAAQRQLIKDGQDPNATKRAARERADGESVMLAELLDEFEVFRSPMREIWRKSPQGRCEARRRINSVFGKLTGRRMSELTDDDFAACMMGHKPAREDGKRTANGQVSRARACLAPVLNWAAHRKPFHKKGAGRSGRIETPDLSLTHDPADDDPTITGIRKRALHQNELLFAQRAAGVIPAAEIWIAAIFLAPAALVLGAFALREASAALSCRLTISPAEIAVSYAASLPRPFRISRSGADVLKAEVYHRAHRNYSSSRSHGIYNITLKSRIPYVRCGGRLIGPMDEPDAKAVAAAMNAVLRPN